MKDEDQKASIFHLSLIANQVNSFHAARPAPMENEK